jgi:hypothetical protein
MTDLVLTTFDWVPETPRGYVRDIRVRWALEEAGLPYRVKSVPFGARGAEHFSHQPFGQVPWCFPTKFVALDVAIACCERQLATVRAKVSEKRFSGHSKVLACAARDRIGVEHPTPASTATETLSV